MDTLLYIKDNYKRIIITGAVALNIKQSNHLLFYYKQKLEEKRQ